MGGQGFVWRRIKQTGPGCVTLQSTGRTVNFRRTKHKFFLNKCNYNNYNTNMTLLQDESEPFWSIFYPTYLILKNRVGLWDHVSVRVCVCVSPRSLVENYSVKVPLLLLGNGYVFYAVRAVSKESRRLVLPRTSCLTVWNNALYHPVIWHYVFHNTNAMQPSPSSEANSCSFSQDIFSVLWNPKFHYRIHKSPPLVPVLSHIFPSNALRSILMLSFHLCLSTPMGLLSSCFSNHGSVSTYLLSHTDRVIRYTTNK
jgi:hypothetical protein